jgi:hypothetical protein
MATSEWNGMPVRIEAVADTPPGDHAPALLVRINGRTTVGAVPERERVRARRLIIEG